VQGDILVGKITPKGDTQLSSWSSASEDWAIHWLPLRRHRRKSQLPWGWRNLQSIRTHGVAPYWLSAPLLPLPSAKVGYRVFLHVPRDPDPQEPEPHPLLVFAPPAEPTRGGRWIAAATQHLSWGFLPFGAWGQGGKSSRNYLSRVAGTCGFSPFRALHSTCGPLGPVSCR